MSSCPNYLDYEIAVLKSNIAACHLKLSDWKAAVDTATAALDALDRLVKQESIAPDGDKSDESVVEIEGDGAAAEEQMEKLKAADKRRSDVQRIRTKALMRRAKGKFELRGWGNLQGAEDGIHSLELNRIFIKSFDEILSSSNFTSHSDQSSPFADYKALAQVPNLAPADKKIVKSALATLPSLITAEREKEMGEMMGKLKEASEIFLISVSLVSKKCLTNQMRNSARQRNLEAVRSING